MFSNIRIFPRLLIGFSCLVVLVAGLSGFVIWSIQEAERLFATTHRLQTAQTIDEQVGKNLMDWRLRVWKGVATGDPTFWDEAMTAGDTVGTTLANLQKHTVDPHRLEMIEQMKGLIADYRVKTDKLRQAVIDNRNESLDTIDGKAAEDAARAAANQIVALTDKLASAYGNAAQQASDAASEEFDNTATIAIVTGLASVLLGIGLGFIIAHSIASPIQAITHAMDRLARHEMEAEIAGVNRKDEVGAMAQAVLVFRDSMVRADQLAADQEATKARAAADQKVAMAKIADSFEQNVGGLVQQLAAASTQLRQTAQAMSANATQTTSQADTVSAAAEEAGAGAQTVAAAAEELSASILEINRQVTQSSQITDKAVADTQRTDAIVHTWQTMPKRSAM
jgi:methyl-accepting chemotaxis protein